MLCDLPEVVLLELYEYLEPPSLIRLGRTCRQLAYSVEEIGVSELARLKESAPEIDPVRQTPCQLPRLYLLLVAFLLDDASYGGGLNVDRRKVISMKDAALSSKEELRRLATLSLTRLQYTAKKDTHSVKEGIAKALYLLGRRHEAQELAELPIEEMAVIQACTDCDWCYNSESALPRNYNICAFLALANGNIRGLESLVQHGFDLRQSLCFV